MKILLRDPSRHVFYAGNHEWTPDHRVAASFADANEAIDQAFNSGLQGLEVVMLFENPDYEIPLTIAGNGLVAEEAC